MTPMRLHVLLLSSLLSLLAHSAMATEELPYQVVDTRMGFEIRRYPAYVVAETRLAGPFEKVGDAGFKVLYAYISGSNRRGEPIAMTAPATQASAAKNETAEKGEKIEMTAPVIQAPVTEGGEDYTLAFVMPAKYTLETLPRPTDPHVTLRQVPPKLIAAHRFSGSWSEENYRRHERQLLDAIELAGVKATSPPMYARYNPPFTPWFMRRNEAMVEITDPNVR